MKHGGPRGPAKPAWRAEFIKERVCFRVFRHSQPEEEFAAIHQQEICTVERQRGRCWNDFPHKHLRLEVQLSARPAGPVSRSLRF
jgi:hypothetical protein